MHVYVTALKLYNGTDHSNLDVLGYSQVFHESWDLHGFIYMYMYIGSGLELEKKKTRVNNETRDEKAMESCPLHCNQLHVFHNIAVVNQFFKYKSIKKRLEKYFMKSNMFFSLLYLFPLHWLKSGEKWNISHECKSRTLKWPSVFGLLTLNGVYK